MTPLLTASTPVMAVQPLAKARIAIQRLPAIAGAGSGGGVTTGAGCPPAAIALITPMASTASKLTMNR